MEWCPRCNKEVGVIIDMPPRHEAATPLVRLLCSHCCCELSTEKKNVAPDDRPSFFSHLFDIQ